MPTITWNRGDTFVYGDQDEKYGVVLDSNTAIVVARNGSHWDVNKASIPATAIPYPRERMHFEAQMAIRGTLAV